MVIQESSDVASSNACKNCIGFPKQTAYLHFRWTKLTVAIAGCIASNDDMGHELNLISEFTAYL